MTTNVSASPPVLDPETIALAGRDLPHGPVPPALAAVAASAADPLLEERVQALATNAGATEERTPLIAATCWHEAGRLLAGRLGRPGEAWLCHSRALAVQPEHTPARHALRRLAYDANDPRLLAGIIDAELERATDDAETTALLVERASSETALGDFTNAMGTLREASGIQPRSLVTHLLQLAVATREMEDAELADILRAIVDAWPDSEREPGMGLMLALLEERLGRHEAALAQLDRPAGAEPGPSRAACAWAEARLSLHTGQPEPAVRALEDLAQAIDGEGAEDLVQALDRFRRTVLALAIGGAPMTGHAIEPATAAVEPRLIAALRAGDFENEDRLVRFLAEAVATPAVRAALLTGAWATNLATGAGSEPTAEIRALGIAGRVLDRLLSTSPDDATREAPSGGPPGMDLHLALRDRDAPRVTAAIEALRDRGADEEERWNLAVLAAWLRDERTDAPEQAVAGLTAVADSLDREPLSRLIRARVSDHARLAELALVEADHADGPGAAALRLAWAGHHTGRLDAGRGAELYRRALEIDPACSLALAALSRGVVDHEALAEAHASAATEADGDDRFGHLLGAGAHRLAMGALEEAVGLFGQALDLRPDDIDLRILLLRLALDRPSLATARLLELPTGGDDLTPRLLCSLGSLALGVDPAAAIDAFSEALALDPSDPIARQGHTEALLAAGRGSLVSSELLKDLDGTEDPEERARLLLRLADVDSRYGKDRTSAVLSLLSLADLLPGHRSTLVELLFHYSRQGHRDELPRVFADLARSVDDAADGAAFAQISWSGTAAGIDLLRLATKLGADTPVHLVQLEALTDSPEERVEVLRAISAALGETPIRLARLAEALEQAGDVPGAIAIAERLIHDEHGDAAVWSALLRMRRATGDAAGEAVALAGLARISGVPEQRVQYLLAEARLARDSLGDNGRAAACCVAALEIDPACEEAHLLGRDLFEAMGDHAGLARLVTQRIRGLEAAPDKHRMLLELTDIRLSIGDASGAKTALGLALELSPEDVAARRRLAAMHVRDDEWPEAIEHLMEAARLNRDPQAGQEIFFELGTLYADHTERTDLAEKSFVKVLGWNRGHFAAMERLADVYARMGNWQRSAQALEQLTIMAESPSVKAAKMVALAATLDTRLSRPADAERLLNEARGLDPMDIAPIRGLAELYTRQRDGMALSVLLDQALATHAASLESNPDQPVLYANVYRILEMKNEDSLASLAVGILDLLGARSDFPDVPPDVVEVHWQGGARAGDAGLAELFCPKTIPPGLRETLRAVEEPISRSLGASAKQVDLPKDSRIDRKHPLALMLGLLGPAFGVRGEIVCYRTTTPGIRFAPGAPGIALVPEGIVSGEDPALIPFAAGSILAFAREGLALATIVEENRLRLLVAGLVRLAVPGYEAPGLDQGELDEEVAFLRRSIPEKVIARVAPFAFECGSALKSPTVRQNLLTIAHRIGLVTTGSLSGALRSMAAEHGRPVTPLALVPGIGSVVSFTFSKDHLELRHRTGI